MAMDLADYGRGLGTTAPDRTTVLWLVPWLRHGGAEAVLANVLAGLGDRYHFVICTTIDIAHNWRPWFRELGCEVFVLSELLPRAAWPMFLERLIEAKKVSVLVNAHSQYGYDIAARLRERFPDVPAYDLLHNDSELGFIRHAARHDRAYDGHIVVSERVAETLVRDYGIDRPRVHAIVNGIDVQERFDPKRYGSSTQNGGSGPDFTIGFVGRLSDEKDPLLFVQMAQEIITNGGPDGPSCRFVIAGDGPLRQKVEERIAEHGLRERVQLLGYIVDVPRLLAQLDLCVLTSRVEGCPLAALETLAMGRPVVATAVGNLPTLLRPPRGRTVSGRDPRDLAAAVLAELRDSRDPARRTKIRNGAVRDFGLATMAERYAALFSMHAATA